MRPTDPRPLRTVREGPAFQQCVARLGGARRIDAALTSLMSGLSYRPEGFPLVGDRGLRIAKTDRIWLRVNGMIESIPPLRLYLQITDTGEVVLWWIEENVDDEIPF